MFLHSCRRSKREVPALQNGPLHCWLQNAVAHQELHFHKALCLCKPENCAEYAVGQNKTVNLLAKKGCGEGGIAQKLAEMFSWLTWDFFFSKQRKAQQNDPVLRRSAGTDGQGAIFQELTCSRTQTQTQMEFPGK